MFCWPNSGWHSAEAQSFSAWRGAERHCLHCPECKLGSLVHHIKDIWWCLAGTATRYMYLLWNIKSVIISWTSKIEFQPCKPHNAFCRETLMFFVSPCFTIIPGQANNFVWYHSSQVELLNDKPMILKSRVARCEDFSRELGWIGSVFWFWCTPTLRMTAV